MDRAHLLFPLLLLCTAIASAEDCTPERVSEMFQKMQDMDLAGEAELKTKLERLTAQNSWTERERNDYTLSLADNSAVDTSEMERGRLVAEMFGLIGRSPVDCDRVNAIEVEVLALVQRQWDEAVAAVQKKLEQTHGNEEQ